MADPDKKNSVTSAAKPPLSKGGGFFDSLGNWVKNDLAKIPNVIPAMEKTLSPITNAIAPVVKSVSDAVTPVVTPVANAIQDDLAKSIPALKKTVSEPVDAITAAGAGSGAVPDAASRDTSAPAHTSQDIDPSWFKATEQEASPKAAVTRSPPQVVIPEVAMAPKTVEEKFMESEHAPAAQINTTPNKYGGLDIDGLLRWIGEKAPQALSGVLGALADSKLMVAGSPELTSTAQGQARLLQQRQLENQKWLAENAPGFQAQANVAQSGGTLPYDIMRSLPDYLKGVDVAGIQQRTAQSLPNLQAQANVAEYGGLAPQKLAQSARLLKLGMNPEAFDLQNGGFANSQGANVGPTALANQYKNNPRALAQSLLQGNAVQPKQPNSVPDMIGMINGLSNAAR
jgi:hypothetical protein